MEVMDESGVYAQVCFPDSIGLGGQGLSDIVKDPELGLLCVQIYNDAMAGVQADSGRRLLPIPGARLTSKWMRHGRSAWS